MKFASVKGGWIIALQPAVPPVQSIGATGSCARHGNRGLFIDQNAIFTTTRIQATTNRFFLWHEFLQVIFNVSNDIVASFQCRSNDTCGTSFSYSIVSLPPPLQQITSPLLPVYAMTTEMPRGGRPNDGNNPI